MSGRIVTDAAGVEWDESDCIDREEQAEDARREPPATAHMNGRTSRG